VIIYNCREENKTNLIPSLLEKIMATCDKYYARRQYMQEKWDCGYFISIEDAIIDGLISGLDEDGDPISDNYLVYWNHREDLETADTGDVIVVDGEDGWCFYRFDFEVNNSMDDIIRYKLDDMDFVWNGDCDDIDELEFLSDDPEYYVLEDGCDGTSSVDGLIAELEANPSISDQFVVIRITEDDYNSENVASWNLE